MANDKVKVATSKLTALADAIRAKSGGSEEITLNDIPTIVPSLAYTPPTWADGSWDDICEALDKHRAGTINLYETPGWEIGAIRNISFKFSYMYNVTRYTKTANGKNYVDVPNQVNNFGIVLSARNMYKITKYIDNWNEVEPSGNINAPFVWDSVGLLFPEVPFLHPNSSIYENGDYSVSEIRSILWDIEDQINGAFKYRIPKVEYDCKLMQDGVLKDGKLNDYIFIRSYDEVRSDSASTITYYASSPATRRSKTYYNLDDGTTTKKAWWLRTPTGASSDWQYRVQNDGSITTNKPSTSANRKNTSYGVAICGCLY